MHFLVTPNLVCIFCEVFSTRCVFSWNHCFRVMTPKLNENYCKKIFLHQIWYLSLAAAALDGAFRNKCYIPINFTEKCLKWKLHLSRFFLLQNLHELLLYVTFAMNIIFSFFHQMNSCFEHFREFEIFLSTLSRCLFHIPLRT